MAYVFWTLTDSAPGYGAYDLFTYMFYVSNCVRSGSLIKGLIDE